MGIGILPPIMENQMEKKMVNETKGTGLPWGIQGFRLSGYEC